MHSLNQRTTLFLSLLALLSVVFAESTTVTNLLFVNDGIEASVVGANPTATTFKMGCPESSPSCLTLSGFTAAITATEGPSTFEMEETLLNTPGWLKMSCKVTGTTKAVCTEAISADGFETSVTTTYGTADMSYGKVTVTGGLDKLAAATSGGSGSGASTVGPALDKKMWGVIALFLSSGIFMLLL